MRQSCLMLFAIVWAMPLAAQELAPELKEKVLQAQPLQFEDPECGIGPGHFRVKGAAVYVETAMRNQTNRQRLLEDSQRTVSEAITDEDQDDNPGAWYILGRVNLYLADIEGADSSFTRVDSLAPECAPEVTALRRNTWIVIRNYALGQMQRNQVDSSLATYRAGLQIYRGEADAFYVMASIQERAEEPDSVVFYLNAALSVEDTSESGVRIRRNAVRRLSRIYAQTGQVDSAVKYLQIVADDAAAKDDTVSLQSAQSQIARTYFNGERYPEALVAFRVLEASKPNDQMVKRNIATVFQAMGQVDSAQMVMAGLGSGVSAMDTTSARFLINRGVNKYSNQDYTAAAADFTRALEAEPSNRLAMINLGLSYNNMKKGPELVEVAERSIAREPLHELSYQFLVQGYVYQQNNKARDATSQLDGLPITIDSLNIQNSPGLMTITGVAFGRTKPSAPINLVFEFIGGDGAVLASSDVAIPALEPKGRADFVAQGNVEGIVNWRYRVQ
jgi:tetratricopeptide (TPR) repeat protein